MSRLKWRLDDGADQPLYATSLCSESTIRLLKINPSQHPSDQIYGSLSVVSLKSNPVYKALSYTWGDSRDIVSIDINGYQIDVTRNLKDALKRLRSIDTKHLVWIDALCINQRDGQERTYQVQLMREIYQTAFEVVVHLGNPDVHEHPSSTRWPRLTSTGERSSIVGVQEWTRDERDVPRIEGVLQIALEYADKFPRPPQGFEVDALAFCLIRWLAGDVHLETIPLLKNRHVLDECIGVLRDMNAKPWVHYPQMRRLRRLILTYSQWNRMWTLQETVLPSNVTVVFGQHSSPLYMFIEAAIHLKKHASSCCHAVLILSESQRDVFDKFMRTLIALHESRELWRTNTDHMRLTILLPQHCRKNATDPRDSIYGLLGLARGWGDSEPIKPRYDIVPKRLFEDVAFRWIAMDKNLNFLFYRVKGSRATARDQNMKAKTQYDAHFGNISQHLMSEASDRIIETAKGDLDHEARRSSKGGLVGQVQLTRSSWAPDWTRMTNRITYQTATETEFITRQFNADKGRCAMHTTRLVTKSSVLSEATVLAVEAYPIGIIKPPHSRIGLPDAPTPRIMLFDDTEPLRYEDIPLTSGKGNNGRPYEPTPGTSHQMTQHEAACRALIADSMIETPATTGLVVAERVTRRATQADVQSVDSWYKWMYSARYKHREVHVPPERDDFVDEGTYRRVLDTDRAVRSVALRRRHVQLDSGHVGMAGGYAQGKDEVMVLLGARTPFVLRKLGPVDIEGSGTRTKQTIYTVVGECFVIGALSGEIVTANEAAGTKPEKIYLI